MLQEIMHIDDEDEARRILMRLGNGLPQVDSFIEEWKSLKKPAPVVIQKVVTEEKIETETQAPKQVKVGANVKK